MHPHHFVLSLWAIGLSLYSTSILAGGGRCGLRDAYPRLEQLVQSPGSSLQAIRSEAGDLAEMLHRNLPYESTPQVAEIFTEIETVSREMEVARTRAQAVALFAEIRAQYNRFLQVELD